MFRDLLDLMTEDSEKVEFPGIWETLEFLSVLTGGLVAARLNGGGGGGGTLLAPRRR